MMDASEIYSKRLNSKEVIFPKQGEFTVKQESHSSSSSSSSPSSLTVGEISIREREDESNRDISPVPVSNSVDDRSGQPDDETQANEIQKTNQKQTPINLLNLCDDPEIPEWLQEFRENLVDDEIPLLPT